MKKRAFELSISFIVMLILTIIVFGFGIKFVYNLSHRSTSLVDQLSEETKDDIENMLYLGKIVAIPINEKEINVGESAVLGIGILNQLGKKEDFKIYVAFATGIDADENEITSIDISEWTFEKYATQAIKENEHKIIPLAFQVPKGSNKGTYIFNVNVCYDDDNPANDIPEVIQKKCSAEYPDLYDYTHQITLFAK